MSDEIACVSHVANGNESSAVLYVEVDDALYAANNASEESISRLVAVLRWYEQYHGYVSLVICTFSIVTNILNIIVLTRSKMRSPVNYLLSGLAGVDMLKMTSYFILALNIFILKKPNMCSGFSKFEIIVSLLMAQNLVITLHLTSMMIAIMMAFYRYIIMRSAATSQGVLTMRSARVTLVAVTIVAVILSSPNYIQQTIYQTDNVTDSWWHRESENADLAKFLSFYIYGLLGKVGGSVVLVVLSGLLLATLHEAAESSKKVRSQRDAAKRERETAGQRRLTMMLIGIVLVFVIAELPQGVLLILSVQSDSVEEVYTDFGDVLDLLTLLSSSVSFILYCSMSKQFRSTFATLFIAPCRVRIDRFFHEPDKSIDDRRISRESTTRGLNQVSPHLITTVNNDAILDEDYDTFHQRATTVETRFFDLSPDSSNSERQNEDLTKTPSWI